MRLHGDVAGTSHLHALKDFKPLAFLQFAVQLEPDHLRQQHGDGLADLMGHVADLLPEPAEADEDADKPLRIAIVGKPNAGKSTLLNALLGEERMITGPEPGLTRDAVGAFLTDAEGQVEVVDTAGLRKRARIEEELEKLAAEIVQGKASDYADYRYRVGRLKGIADALAAADEAGKRLIGQ